MKYSLRTKLSLSYVLVILMVVASTSILMNVFLEKQFKVYIIKRQEIKNNEIVKLISRQYKSEDNKWDMAAIENICLNALEQGMIIKVSDKSGKMIWDATVHNKGLCVEMLSHITQKMSNYYHDFKGGYVEKQYLLANNFVRVGSIVIGYYGPFYFSDNDLVFINTLNKMLTWITIFSLILALLFGAFMARRLSRPIARVINTARQISGGYFGDRITEYSDTKEIGQLTSAINNMAETLDKQEILRKRLSADVAHELRTPLATLQSHMEAMIDGIWNPDAGRLKSCHEEIMRISRMVSDMEKLARVEGENLVLNKTVFDVSELAQHIIHNFEPDFKNKNVELVFNGEKEMVFADRDKISQVLVNLLSNALKYTPQGGSVILSVKGDGDPTQITIKDTGPGISQEDMSYIFERFYRVDKSRNRLTGGSGIGLTIVKTVVEAHKGKVTVNSEPGKGTEFTVILPKPKQPN